LLPPKEKNENEFHEYSIDIESDSSDNIEWDEIVVECRNKFLMALKG
jgi:hypothetical protein